MTCDLLGRPDVWAVFRGRLMAPALEEARPLPYEELVERFGLRSPAQAHQLLTTAKRTFVRNLRAVVAEYVDDPADEAQVDEEIADLERILSHPGA